MSVPCGPKLKVMLDGRVQQVVADTEVGGAAPCEALASGDGAEQERVVRTMS